MTKTRWRRLSFALAIMLGLGGSIALAVYAMRGNVLYFFDPSAVAAEEVEPGQRFRLGGLVVFDSVQRDPQSLAVGFALTDGQADVPVTFNGILPDLFREGQGIIAIGSLNNTGVFEADEVLAKHDETYMPPEVAASLAAREELARGAEQQ